MNVAEGERQACRRAVNLLLNDQITGCEVLCSEHPDSIPLVFLSSYIAFVRAVMSFAEDDIDEADRRLARAQSMSEAASRDATEAGSSFFSRARPTLASTEADSIAAECTLYGALLRLLGDSMMSYVKGGLALRRSYKVFEACEAFLEDPANLEAIRAHPYAPDVAGQVLYGRGIFNVAMALLPPTALKVLGTMGMEGNLDKGLAQLAQVYLSDGAKSPMAAVILLQYFLILCAFVVTPSGRVPLDQARAVLDDVLERYPRGGLWRLFSGRMLRAEGRLAEAVAVFSSLATEDQAWKQLGDAGRYEAGWCLLLAGRYAEAALRFDELVERSQWSKGFYAYMCAVALIRGGRADEAEPYLQRLPSLVRKKRPPPVEEFVLSRARQFTSSTHLPFSERLYLPLEEIFYQWNAFSQMGALLPAYASRLATSAVPVSPERGAMRLLFLGSMLRCLGDKVGALRAFEECLDLRKSVKGETWIEPNVRFELAVEAWGRADMPAAEAFLAKAKACPAGYFLEGRLGFKIIGARQCIDRGTQVIELGLVQAVAKKRQQQKTDKSEGTSAPAAAAAAAAAAAPSNGQEELHRPKPHHHDHHDHHDHHRHRHKVRKHKKANNNHTDEDEDEEFHSAHEDFFC